jgi:hypothetical protein
MSLVGAVLLLIVACMAIDLYRRVVPGTRGVIVIAIATVVLALWLLLEVLGIGGNVRL